MTPVLRRINRMYFRLQKYNIFLYPANVRGIFLPTMHDGQAFTVILRADFRQIADRMKYSYNRQ